MTLSSPIAFPINKVAIIGLGLIGGSWVKALRKQGVVQTIVGYDRNLDSMEQAKQLNIIDEYAGTAKQAVEGAQVVILSVPILAGAEILAFFWVTRLQAVRKVASRQLMKRYLKTTKSF